MRLRPEMEGDNARSNTEYSGTIVREKVAVMGPVSLLFLGINHTLAGSGSRSTY